MALGSCSLFETNFLLVRLREPVFSFVWSEILLYAVLARSAPGPCIGHIYGPGPFHPRSRLNICQRLLLYGLTAHLDLAYGRFRIFLQSISLVYTGIVTLWQ